MEGVLFVLVTLAAVISRPVEARLWRAGKLSDRTTATLFVARFPVVVFLFGLIAGAGPLLALAIAALAALPALVFYGFVLGQLREQKATWLEVPDHKAW